MRRLLALAAALGCVHAASSLYWALGGTWLLQTLGHRIVDAFDGRTWLLLPFVAVKLVAALAPLHRRWPRVLSWLTAAVLILWGGVNTISANLVLGGVIHAPGYDRDGMIGHAWLWDPLFLLWGLALAAGLWRGRRERTVSRAPA